MKKVICLLLTLIVVFSFSACSSSSPASANTLPSGKTDSPDLNSEEMSIATKTLEAIDTFIDGKISQQDARATIKSCHEQFDAIKSDTPDHNIVSMQILLSESTVLLYGQGKSLTDVQAIRNSLASALHLDEIDYSAVTLEAAGANVGEDNINIYPTTVSDEGLSEAPIECFTQYASENGLEGKPFYLTGKVSDSGIIDMNDGNDGKVSYFTLETANGKAMFYDLYHYMLVYKSDNLSSDEWAALFQGEANSDYSFPAEVGNVKVVGIYQGFSDNYSAPTFIYGMPQFFMETYASKGNEGGSATESASKSDDSENITDPTSVINNSSYSANGITISIGQPKYDKSWGGYYYTDLAVKNDSASDIYYEVEYVKVNGFQLPVLSFGDVYSEMSSSTQVSFSTDDMRLAMIDHILDIELRVSIMESSSKSIIDTATLSLATSDAGKYTQSYDFGWQEVYSENGLRICARLGENSESYPAVFFIENNTGKTVSLSYDDIAINNVMTGQMMTGVQVVNGARCVTGMQKALLEMMGGDIPENRDINSIVLKFSFLPISDDGSFSTANLYYSDKITISR